MFSNFSFLDYLWKSLTVVAATSTIILIFCILLENIFVKHSSGKERRWFYNFQSTVLLISILFGFSIVKADPEIISACFTKFAHSSDSITITRLISFSYILGLFLLLTWDIAKTSLCLKRISKLVPLESDRIQNQIQKASDKLQISRPVRTYLCEYESSPFVFGFFRYCLYLPKHLFISGDDEKVEALIFHEIAHIKGNDSVWLVVTHLCKRILFFIPIIYLVDNKHHLAVELAADELAVLKGQVRSKKLIESLIEMASLKSYQQTVFQVNATKGYKYLKERIISVGSIKQRKRLDWKFSLSATLALLLSTWFAMAQVPTTEESSANSYDGLMCSQIQHEKIIETWLRIQSSPNKCEK